jgi:HEPN superfamily Toprim-like protein
MGSMIELSVGELDIDTGKNQFFFDHSPLFQVTDVCQIPYTYVGKDHAYIIEHQEGYSRKLARVLPRLDLLGFPLEVQQYWFDQFFEDYSEQMSSYEDSEHLKDIAARRQSTAR